MAFIIKYPTDIIDNKEIVVPKAPAMVNSFVEMYLSSLSFEWIGLICRMKAFIRPLIGKSIPAEHANATRIF